MIKLPRQEKASSDAMVWLGGLIKNFALISLVEAQKNLEDMQKIQKQKEK